MASKMKVSPAPKQGGKAVFGAPTKTSVVAAPKQSKGKAASGKASKKSVTPAGKC